MMHCGYFDTTRNGNDSSFLTPTVVGRRRPFPVKYLSKVTPPFKKRWPRDINKDIRLFSQRGRPLCTWILPGQGRPTSITLGIKKLKTLTLGYRMLKTASLCILSFDKVPECDGQTDRWICRSIYSAWKASFVQRCRNDMNELKQKLMSTRN